VNTWSILCVHKESWQLCVLLQEFTTNGVFPATAPHVHDIGAVVINFNRFVRERTRCSQIHESYSLLPIWRFLCMISGQDCCHATQLLSSSCAHAIMLLREPDYTTYMYVDHFVFCSFAFQASAFCVSFVCRCLLCLHVCVRMQVCMHMHACMPTNSSPYRNLIH
jgi:hypothetical protein